MTDQRYPVSGNIRMWFVTASGLANRAAPTEAEMAAALDISDAVSWNDKDFGVQASNTTEDPAITAKGRTTTRGASQYGGGLSMYYPFDRSDTTSVYVQAENALGAPGTVGYIVVRVDGVELATPTGTAAHPGTTAEAGDYVNIFRVETAGYAQAITGEEAFRYTVTFLSKGFVKTFAVVRASATPDAPVITGDATATVGDYIPLNATLVGREYTRGLRWTVDDPDIGTVSRNAIVTARGTGTLTVTATDEATGASDTHEITIS